MLRKSYVMFFAILSCLKFSRGLASGQMQDAMSSCLTSLNHLSSGFIHSFLTYWNSFWNELKKQTANRYYYNKKLQKQIFHCLRRPSQLINSSPGNTGNCILESPMLKTFQGKHAPGPPQKFVPPTLTVYISLKAEPRLHPVLSNTIENPIGILRDLSFYGQPILEGEQRMQTAEWVINHCKM